MDRFKQILTDINETLVSNRIQATTHLVQPQENMDDDIREEAYEMAVASLKSIVSRAAGVLKKLPPFDITSILSMYVGVGVGVGVSVGKGVGVGVSVGSGVGVGSTKGSS